MMKLIGRWGGVLRFFPSDEYARIGIAEAISSMCANEDQVRWLVSRLPQLYNEWPGMLEVRAGFCTRHRPADGSEAALGTDSPAFAALCPDDSLKNAELNAGQRLIGGTVEAFSVDPEMDRLARSCMKPRDPLAGVKSATDAEIEAIKRQQEANRKNHADVDAILAERGI
jgi:hypothetical protein